MNFRQFDTDGRAKAPLVASLVQGCALVKNKSVKVLLSSGSPLSVRVNSSLPNNCKESVMSGCTRLIFSRCLLVLTRATVLAPPEPEPVDDSEELRAAAAELEALRSQLDPARRQLKGINEVVESYLRQYQIGRKTWLDVLNVQREKIAALAALADVEYSVETAKVKLLTLTGHINAENVLRIHD